MADVFSVTRQLRPVTVESAHEAEAALDIQWPQGYVSFVTRYGAGDISTFVRVYVPQRVVDEREAWRDRVREYYFWDAGADVLSRDEVLASVVIADTHGGDELIMAPSGGLYVLPRDEGLIYPVGSDFDEALTWLLESGILTEPLAVAAFEPHEGRTRIDFSVPRADDGLVEELVSLLSPEHRLTGDEEDFVELFVSPLGGSVSVLVEQDETTVGLSSDATADAGVLRTVEELLAERGFTRG